MLQAVEVLRNPVPVRDVLRDIRRPLEDEGYQPLKVQSVPVPSAKLHPDDPFLDAGFIGQMFHTLTIASMIAAVEEVWP